MILRCIECGRESATGRRWRAYLATEPRDDDPSDVAVYCPICAQREFGTLGEAGDASSDIETS